MSFYFTKGGCHFGNLFVFLYSSEAEPIMITHNAVIRHVLSLNNSYIFAMSLNTNRMGQNSCFHYMKPAQNGADRSIIEVLRILTALFGLAVF